MLIGVPTEIKTHEYRVGINPEGVRQLVRAGHSVQVQAGAGESSGYTDATFSRHGAKIVPTAADAWSGDMVIKVKEPLPDEFQYFREDLILYTYLHLAAFPELTGELLAKKVAGVAYETITDDAGGLPLLRPMSEIAGRMAAQVGATHLEREKGGKGILLGGIPGTPRGRVVILGGGIVGAASARIAIGLGARVTVLDIDANRMHYLEDVFGNAIETMYSNPGNIEAEVSQADLVIGAVLLAGAAAPTLVTRDLLKKMDDGAVVVDVAVDQGGCIETCRPTTHDNPTYVEEGVVHYCVANMPGAVPRTSTTALTNATLPGALALAAEGPEAAARTNVHLARGLNTLRGECVCAPVAEAHGLSYTPLAKIL